MPNKSEKQSNNRVKAEKGVITIPDPSDPNKTIQLALPKAQPKKKYNLHKISRKIEIAIVRLIQKKPFFGLVATKMKRIPSTQIISGNCPTMAVSMQGGLTLLYHPEFIEKHQLTELMAVIEHEVLHIVNKHFEREEFFKKAEGINESKSREALQFHQWWNFAADIAINQYIKGLPEGGLKPLDGWEERMHTEYYFHKIEETGGEGYEGCHTIDLHDLWGHLTEEEKDSIQEAIREAYKESEKYPGNLAGDVKKLIEAYINKPLPWNQILRRYLTDEVTSEKIVNYSRYDRRFDTIPGYKRKPTMELVVAFDTSGSVSDKDLAVFINEIHTIKRRTSAQMTLIQADHEIQHVEKYDGKINVNIHGRGGTSFIPVFDWIKKNKKRSLNLTLIYLTDGYGPAPADAPSFIKTIWVYTPNHEQPCTWGRHITLNGY